MSDGIYAVNGVFLTPSKDPIWLMDVSHGEYVSELFREIGTGDEEIYLTISEDRLVHYLGLNPEPGSFEFKLHEMAKNLNARIEELRVELGLSFDEMMALVWSWP